MKPNIYKSIKEGTQDPDELFQNAVKHDAEPLDDLEDIAALIASSDQHLLNAGYSQQEIVQNDSKHLAKVQESGTSGSSVFDRLSEQVYQGPPDIDGYMKDVEELIAKSSRTNEAARKMMDKHKQEPNAPRKLAPGEFGYPTGCVYNIDPEPVGGATYRYAPHIRPFLTIEGKKTHTTDFKEIERAVNGPYLSYMLRELTKAGIEAGIYTTNRHTKKYLALIIDGFLFHYDGQQLHLMQQVDLEKMKIEEPGYTQAMQVDFMVWSRYLIDIHKPADEVLAKMKLFIEDRIGMTRVVIEKKLFMDKKSKRMRYYPLTDPGNYARDYSNYPSKFTPQTD